MKSGAEIETRNSVEGHSIFIKNLPRTATDEQVEEEFKSFGPIKPGGVQLRSNKGFCYGFVEFEQLSSMQNAVKAGMVTIANRQVFIEEKRTKTRVEGHSIFIKNLPRTVTDEQIEEEFKSFGPIKPGSVQLRSNKGFCYGFVEFEQLSSMRNAVKAGMVTIANSQVFIEEKRTTTRVGGRGPSPPGRGGFRNDFGGGGGKFNGGRGYPGNDFGHCGDYTARPGPSGGCGEGYQPVEQNGKVAGGHQGGMNQAT